MFIPKTQPQATLLLIQVALKPPHLFQTACIWFSRNQQPVAHAPKIQIVAQAHVTETPIHAHVIQMPHHQATLANATLALN